MKIRIHETVRAAAAALGAAVIAASCAAPLKISEEADPLALLEPGALVYARLSGETARDLAPALLSPAQAGQAKKLLDRTKVAALSLGSSEELKDGLPGTGPEIPLPAKAAAKSPAFQAALIGDYPFRAANFSLGSDPDWKGAKPGYYNAKLGLYAAVPGPRLVLASDRPLDSLLARAKRPGASPIPPGLSDLASRQLVLWAPEPFSGIGAALVGEAMDIPARGLLVAASPVPGEKGRYEATVVFAMEDAKALKTYRGILKLAWYGIADLLFGDDAEAAIALPVKTEGEFFVVSKIELSGESLARVLSALKGRR